ncbi:MAG: hypothetical protein K9J81_08880 [Desulfohalobiaceae bacterium]|nr:hypothetical protein [Desulfohalobiaceae bacterium]
MILDLFPCKRWMPRLVLACLILIPVIPEAQAEKPQLLTAGVGLAGVRDSDHDEIPFGVLKYRSAWIYKHLRP